MEFNKKHKGIKKGSSGMNYENFAERIKPLYDFNTYKKPKANIVRISVKKRWNDNSHNKKEQIFTIKQQKILFSKRNYFTGWKD